MFKFYRSVLAAGVVALGLAACGDNVTIAPPPPPPSAGVTSVTVTPANATVGIGQSIQIAASVVADSGVATTLNWTTSNELIATVSSSGLVTGVALGTTTIIATSTVNPARSAAVSITVTNSSTFTVSPSTLALAPGQTSNLSVLAAPAVGQVVGTPVATSLSPGIASAGTCTNPDNNASTCPVTGVSQGTAVITVVETIGGVSFTQTVTVNVGAAASISINAVNTGATAGTILTPNLRCVGVVGAPVILTNVNCQIDVVLNLTAGIQPLDSLNVYLQKGTVAAGAPIFDGRPLGPVCAVAAAPCPFFRRAAQQIYGNTIPSSGPVTLLINTANFTKNVAVGTAVVDWFNGPTALISQVFPHGLTGGSVLNCQVGAGDPTCAIINSMIFNNADGWTADMTKCDSVIANGIVCQPANPATPAGGFATSIQANAGATYWGGPTPTGQITAELYAVVYDNNPGFPVGSQLNRCANLLGDGSGCIKSVNWTIGSVFAGCTGAIQSQIGPVPAVAVPPTPFFRQVFGTGANSTDACAAYENTGIRRDNVIVLANALDAQNNVFPGTTPVSGTIPIIPNTVVFGSTPDSNRFDYKAPAGVDCASAPPGASCIATPTVVGAEGFNWVNGIFPFTPTGTLAIDLGVGAAPNFLIFASASGGPFTVFPTLVTTGADLPETNTNCGLAPGCDGFVLEATAVDLLGNGGTSVVSTFFGVDRTSPVIRISTVAAPSSFASSYLGGGTAAVLDSTTYDAFTAGPASIYAANVVTAGQQMLFLSAAAGTNDSLRIDAIDARSGLSRAIEYTNIFAQGGLTGAQSNVYVTTTGVFGPGLIDGWLPAPALHVTNGRVGGAPPVTAGYYTTTEFVLDRAGNVSGCPQDGPILGAFGTDVNCIGAPPSATGGTNTGVPGSQNANLFARRTLALDPGLPAVTGVSPNSHYVGNSSQTFTLGSQDDLEVIDARLRIQYPNVTDGSPAALASPGLVFPFAQSLTFLASNGNGTGPAAGAPTAGSNVFGYFAPIGIRFDNSIINPSLSSLVLDMFTLNVQETCLGAASPVAACAVNGDPIPFSGGGSVALAKPNNVAVQVRDVFGSWIFNTISAGANPPSTGVSAEFVSPILAATVDAPGGFAVTYYNAGVATSCPQGGVPQPANTVSCVSTGVNWRAEPSLSTPGATEVFRSVESLSTTLPIFVRVDLYGLNAASEWVFIQRCTVPVAILPNTGPQACGGGTVTGLDNGNERYWLYRFTSIPGTGFTQFRALGVDGNGFGLFSTRQP